MFFPAKHLLYISATSLLISSCGDNNDYQQAPVGPSLNVSVQSPQPGDCLSEISLEGVVAPATATIVFSQAGTLEKGQIPLREGMTFTKGQLLCQINNKNAYRELTAIKTEVINKLTALMPEIKRTLPYKAIDKWKAFIEALKPVALLPAYPSTRLPEEKDIPELKQLESTYKKAVELEKGMKGFFYVAPFDGTVSRVMREEDESVKAGEIVAELTGSGTMQLEVVLRGAQIQQIDKRKNYPLATKNGRPAGTAVFHQWISKKNGIRTCAFTIQPSKGDQPIAGTKLNMLLKEKSNTPCTIVLASQICHDSVQIVQNGKIEKLPVKVVGREGQLVRVTGLTVDQAILLDAYENAPQDIRFVASRK